MSKSDHLSGINSSSNPFDRVLERLQLEQLEEFIFCFNGKSAGISRIFGGQVIAQSFVAAQSTVSSDLHLHSLHAYFLRPGIMKKPITFNVDPVRDGKSFFTRTVKAIQNKEVIFTMTASFQKDEPNQYHHSIEMPNVPMPENLKDEIQMREENIDKVPKGLEDIFLKQREYTQKVVEWNDVFDPKKMLPIRNVWIKPNGDIPLDNTLNKAFLAYVSDAGLLAPGLYAHGLSYMSPDILMASLDHAMWFHKKDFIWNDWILYSTDSPFTGNSRNLGRGTFFTRDGEVIASVIQEGLLRIKKS
tara:strand:- start:34 stop:939 length:906 start_codon:yes stop_codon:yes gene_type:complete